VLLHGFSADHRMWDVEAAAWRRTQRVVTIDFRGHGRTPAPRATYASHEDVVRVLDALSIPKATLVGLSYGGQVAIDLALTHPNRVKALVLVSSGLTGFVSTEPMTWMAPVIAAARAGDVAGASRAWLATPLMQVRDASQAARLARIVNHNAGLWAMRSNPATVPDPPAIRRLGEIRIPVLVLIGSDDIPGSRATADTLARGIPGARLVSLPAGHMLNFGDPAGFRREVEGFLHAVVARRFPP
jgi:pimeloyl-ACP methyl ester carboxylesterase